MLRIKRLKDDSEQVKYNDPSIPLFAGPGKLSMYPGMDMLCHWHEDIEYMKATGGQMYYYINGEKILLREGDGVLTNTRQMHYYAPYRKQDCEFYSILFRTELLTGNREIAGRYIYPVLEKSGFTHLYLNHEIEEQNELIKRFDRVLQYRLDNLPDTELLMIGELTQIWGKIFLIMKKDEPFPDTKERENVQIQRQMLSFIYENYEKKITLDEIAASGNVGRSKCCRLFKKYLDRTPLEFLNVCRLEKSVSLLMNPSLSITEVAFSSGFQGASYYAEIFRKYKGVSPSDYRQKNRETGEQ